MCRKKHKKKILKTSKKNDGIAFYFHETGHTIDFDNTAIIAEEKAYNRGNGDQENEPHRASKSADGIRNRPNLGRHHGEHTKNLNATGVEITVGITQCKCS